MMSSPEGRALEGYVVSLDVTLLFSAVRSVYDVAFAQCGGQGQRAGWTRGGRDVGGGMFLVYGASF